MTDCLFCKMVAGEIPTDPLYDDAAQMEQLASEVVPALASTIRP